MKSKIIISYFVLLVILSTNLCLGQKMENSLQLSGQWSYKLDPQKIGINQKWYEVKNLTFDGKLMVPEFFEQQIEKEFDGWVWYFSEFDLPKQAKNKKLALVFEGVDDDASIWINGRFVGEHKGYSEKFYFDVSDFVTKNKNQIAVLVSDHGGPGGIYKPVYLKFYQTEKELFETKISKSTARKSPAWVSEGIIYEIFPRSFTKEGNFKALINKLPYLKELGVTILWLMPIHPIGELKRKGSLGSPYSVKDYYAVNPEYGTKEDFRKFVNEAHKLGFKVIIDEVLNHCAWDNELVKKHPEWFTKDKNGNLIPPNSDWTDVVDFNYDNPQLRKYMIEMLKYWVREFDIDGFRMDVSELVPTDFWEEARTELEKIKPQFWLSEGTLPEHHLKAFDMTYSWNIYDLFKPILQGERLPNTILNSLKIEEYTFPKNSLRMRFNENHDKVRATEVFGYDGSLITAGLVFALNGVPLVHAGQEVGEKKFSSLFEKTEINWQTDLNKNEHYQLIKKLIELRKRNSKLSLGKISGINIDEKIVAFTNLVDGKGIVAFFNFDRNTKSLDFNFIEELRGYKFDLSKAIGRKYKLDEERMGRPANKIVNLESLGFIILEVSK
ncbi:MAG: alpha-amylase family glycosyl hydrolase [Ignavibacteria bacterium]|nr:alpha-amylase family glycosyl hydrolase [Ignavibacteria bacterium]